MFMLQCIWYHCIDEGDDDIGPTDPLRRSMTKIFEAMATTPSLTECSRIYPHPPSSPTTTCERHAYQ